MSKLVTLVFAMIMGMSSLSLASEVGSAEALSNDVEVATVLEILGATDDNQSRFLCAKVKARYWACYRMSSTDEERLECDYTYCPTVNNRCNSIPKECSNIK